MSLVGAAIAIHVAMGAAWTLATLLVAITRRFRGRWLLPGLAGLNMLAGIYLWHVLHAGPWRAREHLLVAGTFCAFIAFGMQVPMVLIMPAGARRLEGPALAGFRTSAVLVVAAAAAMIASRL